MIRILAYIFHFEEKELPMSCVEKYQWISMIKLTGIKTVLKECMAIVGIDNFNLLQTDIS